MDRPRSRVTIRDVAAVAGISPATVSRVLNGSAVVRPETVARVHAAVAASGYVIDPVGRALRRQTTSTWHVIVPDIQSQFFTGVIRGVEAVAGTNGLSVVLWNTDERHDREEQAIAQAVAWRPAGVLLVATSETLTDLTPITRAGVPLVLIDRRVKGYSGDAVYTDNLQVGRLAAQHLITRGHRRIACIAGPPDVSAIEDRLTGFREVLDAHGIGLPERRIARADLHLSGGQRALRELLGGPADDGEPIEAVYVTNGPLTAGAFHQLQVAGLAVPEALALVGTDDDEWTRMVHPALTVVAQPIERIARLAAETLVVRAQGGRDMVGATVLPPTLLVRSSS